MRTILVAALALLVAVPSADAARRKKKAGDIDKGVYEDFKYDFTIKVSDEWKVRTYPDESNTRLVMTQKNYGIPTHYQGVEDYTQVPRIVLYADKSDMNVQAFLDSLLSESYSSDQKGAMLNEFEILTRDERPDAKGKKPMTVNGHRAMVWRGQVKYVKNIQRSSTSIGGERVHGAYGGSIFAVKSGDHLLVGHLICEWEFFQDVEKEFMAMMETVKWPKADKAQN